MTVTIDPTGGLGQTEMLRRLAQVAELAVAKIYPDEEIDLQHINQSENTTYLLTKPDGERCVLRIHRTGYHSDAAIRSEHAWLEGLRLDSGVRTPAVLTSVDGDTITKIITDELPDGRNCVFFEFLDGVEPDEHALKENFPKLGEVTAQMHEHVLSWKLPEHFERFHWNLDTIFGTNPHWGHWHDCPDSNVRALDVLSRAVETLKRRLTAFGMGADRFGLVHADMRLANLLLHEGEPRVIDFDDCGFSWFMYDLATSVSFIEHRADVMELVDAWLGGYERVRALSPEVLAEIPSFIMLRRMLIVAWCGSHAETELAVELGAEFVDISCDLADNYLSKMG